MEEAAERPEEQALAPTPPRRQDAPSGLSSEVSGTPQSQDMGMGALLEQYEESQHTQLRRGDHGSAVVIVPENAEGRPVISINRARAEIGWRDLQTKKDAEEVVDYNKGGLIVSVDGVRGFVPLSQIVELRRGGSEDEVEEKLRAMRGQTLYLK